MSKRDRDIDEIISLLDELKAEVTKHGGTLPNPKQNPEFYARLTAFIDILKEEGIKMPLSEIAERLGVSYALLRKRLSEYRKIEKKEEEEAPTPTPPPETAGTPPLIPEAMIEARDEAGEKEEKHVEEVEEEPVTKRTAIRIMEAIKRHFGRKAEQLAKEEVDKIIKYGKIIYDEYEKQCYANGFDSGEECVRAAFTALFEITPKLYELEKKYEALKGLAAFLIRLTDDYMALLYIIDEASRNLSSEEALDLLDNIAEEVLSSGE